MAEPSFPPTAREGDRVTALLKTLPGFPSPQGRSPNPSPRTPPGPTGLAPPQPPRVLRAPAPGRVALQRPGTFRLLLRLRRRPLRDRSQPAPHRVPGAGRLRPEQRTHFVGFRALIPPPHFVLDRGSRPACLTALGP